MVDKIDGKFYTKQIDIKQMATPNYELYNLYPVVYTHKFEGCNVECRDMSQKAENFTSKAKLFMDPYDVRLYTTVDFNGSSNVDVNKLIQVLSVPTNVKRLIRRDDDYTMEISKQNSGSLVSKIYGSDPEVYERVEQLPINQDLKIGTIFTLNESNFSTDTDKYVKTVLSEALSSKDKLSVIPFHRRTPIMYLLPQETINATFDVKIAPPTKSAILIDWFSRPAPDTLRIGTRLSENPLRILKETGQVTFPDTEITKVDKIISDIYKTQAL